MTHPAIDDAAAAELRDQVGDRPGTAIVVRRHEPAAEPPPTALTKVKARVRRAAVPVIARLRQELDRAGAEELAGIRSEVAELRSELARTRAEHAAELAALHEELASTRPARQG